MIRLGGVKGLAPGHFLESRIFFLISPHYSLLKMTSTLAKRKIKKFAQIWACPLFPRPHYRSKMKLSKYGHIIYRWITNFKLIQNFNRTYGQKSLRNILWAVERGYVKSGSSYTRIGWKSHDYTYFKVQYYWNPEFDLLLYKTIDCNIIHPIGHYFGGLHSF